MHPLFFLFCLLLSMNSLFAQSNAELNKKNDTIGIVSLCSNSSGQPGYMVKNGKGQDEFQSVDQFAKSKAIVQSNSLPGKVSEKAKTGAAPSAQTKGKEAVVAGQSTGRGASALPDKLPPVLAEGPPSHH